MARAYFDQNPFGAAPIEPGLDVIRRTYSQKAPTPMESIEGLVKSPVTNLAVAGISRLVRESEADERQAALEQQRADQVAALEGQRKAAAERALGIERQIGELEAPSMVMPQAGITGIPELARLSAPSAVPREMAGRVPQAASPQDIGSAARWQQGLMARWNGGENTPELAKMIKAGEEQMTLQGMADVANAIRGGASAEEALAASQSALQQREQSRMRPQAAPGEADVQAALLGQRAGGFSSGMQGAYMTAEELDALPPLAAMAGLAEGASNSEAMAELVRIADTPDEQLTEEQVSGFNAATRALEAAGSRAAVNLLMNEEVREAVTGRAPRGQGGWRARQRLSEIESLQGQLTQERQAVRDVQAQEAAVPEVEQLPRTFADYASQYQAAVAAGDTAKASRLMQSVEGATDLIPTTLMQMVTGSKEAKARGALLKAGAKVAEMKAKANLDSAKAANDRAKAAASVSRAVTAAKNAKSFKDLRIAQAELARANASKAREMAAKTALEVAKAKLRLEGKKSPDALNRIEKSGVALDMMAMLSSGAADTDPGRFGQLRGQLEALTGKSFEGTTFITTDPSTYAPLRQYISTRHSKVARDIIGTVEGMNRSSQAQERIAIAESRAQLAEEKAAGGAGVGEITSAIKVLRDVARDSNTPKEDKERAREMVRYYLRRLGALTGGETPVAQAARSAEKLNKTAEETQTLLNEAKGL